MVSGLGSRRAHNAGHGGQRVPFSERGITGAASESRANTVTLRAASAFISSGFCAGQMKETSVAPSFSSPTSSVDGARTLKTISALDQKSAALGAIVAPAAL